MLTKVTESRSQFRMSSSAVFSWLVVGVLTLAPVAGRADDATADHQAIEQAAEKFVAAYNGKNATAMAELFGANARIEESDGTIVEGREQIRAAFGALFEANPNAAISVRMDSIRRVTPDVAVEEGWTEYFPDGEMLTSRSQYMVVHLKRDGNWTMASVRSMNREVVSNYEYLRELEWLIGDWVDESGDSVVKTSCRWDPDRNFILQDFEAHDDQGLALRGTHRIGWDAQKKQFRSWIFDHSGAFAEGVWTAAEGTWVVKMTGVGVDGTPASATRRLHREGPERIVVDVTDRLVGSEELPDATIVMVRPPALPKVVSEAK